MKTAAMTLALTLGLSALNTMAQDEGGPPKRDAGQSRRAGPGIQREERRSQRPQAEDAGLEKRSEDVRSTQRQPGGPGGLPERMGRGGRGFGPPGMAPSRSQGGDEVAPMRRRGGPQGRFGQGGPGVGAGVRGQGFGPPGMGHNGSERSEAVCPECGRPVGPLGQQGRFGMGPGFRRWGRGFGFGPPAMAPGRGFGSGGAGPMFRSPGGRFGQRSPGLGPQQSRGPGFGSPRWGGNRETPTPPRGGFGPMRRGFGDPDGPEGSFERPGSSARPEGRGPANRPPLDQDNR